MVSDKQFLSDIDDVFLESLVISLKSQGIFFFTNMVIYLMANLTRFFWNSNGNPRRIAIA